MHKSVKRHFDDICEDERLRNSSTSGIRAPATLSKAPQNPRCGRGGGRPEVLGEGRPGVFFFLEAPDGRLDGFALC